MPFLWLKALHIISMVCWFAGLFYLPRLFVYHATANDAISIERFKIMERKLYRYIMMPSMLLTLIFGVWMLSSSVAFYKTQAWMHAKLTLVVLLIGYHHICGAYVKKFAKDANTHSAKFYRWFNEVPSVLLIAIIILAVVKPF
jgi:putative membrane protein